MQATLNQAGPAPNAPAPSAHPFAGVAAKLAVVGAIGTTVFLTTTIWQHYELNRLHQTLEQVTQRPNRLQTPTSTVNDPAQPDVTSAGSGSKPLEQVQRDGSHNSVVNPAQRDTVYVDRYVSAPTPAMQPRLRSLSPEPARQGNTANAAVPPVNSTDLAVPATDGSRTGSVKKVNNQPVLTTSPTPKQLDILNPTTKPGAEGVAMNRPAKSHQSLRQAIDGQRYTPSKADRSVQTQSTVSAASDQLMAGGVNETNRPVVAYDLATARPMSLNTVHWNELLAQQAKRMRPARTVVVGGQMPEVSRPVQPFVARVRAGFGAEISTTMRSVGVFSELLAGNHWRVGVGLSQATYGTSTFRNEFDFNENTHEDFRREYARNIDPRHDILNIQMHTLRLQLPVSIGYRFPLSQALSLLPAVGTNVNLTNQQYLSYYHLLPFLGQYDIPQYRYNRPVSLVDNLTFSANLEWQRKHWVAQGGPVVTMPVATSLPQSDPLMSHQPVAVGLRLRLFYQF